MGVEGGGALEIAEQRIETARKLTAEAKGIADKNIDKAKKLIEKARA